MTASDATNRALRLLRLSALAVFASLTTAHATADESTARHAADWESPQAIVKALYQSISAEAGEQRDHARFLKLFIDGAQLAVAFDTPAISGLSMATPADLLSQTESAYGATGFHETGVRTEVEQLGLMANVTSSFEVRLRKNDPEPMMRGLNHFQLLNDGERWWIVSNTGILHTANNPLPEKWLLGD